MRFGYVPAIIVSSPDAAEKFLKSYDQVFFACRPRHEGSWYIAHGLRNSTFGQYGTFWRNMRKLCILRLLSNYKIKLFLPMRMGEIGSLVKSLKQAAFHGAAVNLSAAISSLGANMNCLMIFGKMGVDKDFDDRGFREVIEEALHVAAMANLCDYFPQLRVPDLQRFARWLKALSKVFDNFPKKIINQHLESKKHKQTYQ
ncbi:cytochrome P450 CYP736A12-like [Coffea eugenioides]|uniref:cytochrome P450 CYP736A12-like n=1 Tax=Coffea eugenioides TaxID=49369 RepID=UPI000F606827|nr:cytochrome P450 CYP736A12-like [Coffea eugenioides]